MCCMQNVIIFLNTNILMNGGIAFLTFVKTFRNKVYVICFDAGIWLAHANLSSIDEIDCS